EWEGGGGDGRAAVGLHAAIVGEIGVRVMGKAPDLDLADLARRQWLAVGIDDREAMIAERPSDAAEAPLLAGDRRDPAGLARAVTLGDRNAEAPLEPTPFLGRKRRPARGEKAHGPQVVGRRARFGG